MTRRTEVELALERVKLLERLLVVQHAGPGELELCFSIRRALERTVSRMKEEEPA